jgi:uncharacterized protein with HEPN domain
MGYSALRDDLRTTYAVTRCFEIISEASRRLPDALKTRHPSIQGRGMAAAGNIYRYEDEAAAVRGVWDTPSLHWPLLRIVVERASAASAAIRSHSSGRVTSHGRGGLERFYGDWKGIRAAIFYLCHHRACPGDPRLSL